MWRRRLKTLSVAGFFVPKIDPEPCVHAGPGNRILRFSVLIHQPTRTEDIVPILKL
jgi:hypothetical protein